MGIARAALKPQDTWRLEDIFEADDAWERMFAETGEGMKLLPDCQGKLGAIEQLKPALDLMFGLGRKAEQLYTYAKMRRDEDNNVTKYQGMCDRALSLSVQLGTACSFLAPELLALGEDYLSQAVDRIGFEDYHVYLRDLIRRKPHTLSAAEERIVAMAGELAAAPGTVYDMLTDADMKFPKITDHDGQQVEVTHANYIPLMMGPNRDVRRAAFEAMYGTFKSFAATVPALYSASVKSDLFSAQAGNFTSALEAALFPDEVPASVYDNLIAAVRDHLPNLDRFVRLNAKLNGLDAPEMWDLYVPVALGFDIKLGFDDAYALVCDCLKPLGEDYIDVLHRAKKERWIDPYPNEGKSSGAYSWGTYDSHPYVLLNHHDDLDGLQTIAHEMGHAMHSYYSYRAQPYTTSDYSLFVAEVASTVNEVLVLLELLERHREPEAQGYLLYNLLDSYRTTVFRQTMFAEFEKASHDMAERGEALTVDSLNAVYAQLNADYYQGVGQSGWIAYEWMRIPHFYRAFYVYKYATGFSAATAIATKIRAEGAPAVTAYKRFLSAGSSLPPIEALKLAGIDMSQKEPVERALRMFDELLEQYEGVVAGMIR